MLWPKEKFLIMPHENWEGGGKPGGNPGGNLCAEGAANRRAIRGGGSESSGAGGKVNRGKLR